MVMFDATYNPRGAMPTKTMETIKVTKGAGEEANDAKREAWLMARLNEFKAAQQAGELPKPPSVAAMEKMLDYGGSETTTEICLPDALMNNTRVGAMLDTMALLCGGRRESIIEDLHMRVYLFLTPEAETKFHNLAETLLWDYTGCSFG